MNNVSGDLIKQQVREYWNTQPCGTQFSESAKFTREYFDDIEAHRYFIEPDIFSFAQFTRFRDKKILEVGIGAGSDFVQWVRSGAQAFGIDATQEGVNHVKQRLAVYELNAQDVRVADCENLPYEDNAFDLVYSWGVVHHTPDTPRAFNELIRVCKPGGLCKVMVYNRRSLLSYFFWVKYALLKGRPWKTLSWCLYHHMESIGTKAYTKSEIMDMIKSQPVENVLIKPKLTYYDRMERFKMPLRLIAQASAWLLGGDKVGWFLTIQFSKKR
jgi:ubiquinone/menaquinone biosynthesis C-methylase UbiE